MHISMEFDIQMHVTYVSRLIGHPVFQFLFIDEMDGMFWPIICTRHPPFDIFFNFSLPALYGAPYRYTGVSRTDAYSWWPRLCKLTKILDSVTFHPGAIGACRMYCLSSLKKLEEPHC